MSTVRRRWRGLNLIFEEYYCPSFLISWLYDIMKNEVNWMKSIKLNALSYMGIRVLNIIFPILTGTYVARVLDRTDYGYFNSVDTILSFFLPSQLMGSITTVYVPSVMSRITKKDLNRTFSNLFYLCHSLYNFWPLLSIS